MIDLRKNRLTKCLIIGCSLLSLSAVAQTSVWQVSKGDDSIYIGGTLHILPKEQIPLPKEFEYAYNHADTVLLEAPMPDPSDTQAQMNILTTLSYKDGELLANKLTPEIEQKLETKLAEFGANINELNHFRPFMVSVILMSMELQKQHLIGEGVDAHFVKRANTDGKTLSYLETLDYQLQLFKQMGENSESQFIENNLAQLSNYAELFTSMTAAWRSGNTKQLNELVVKPLQKNDPDTFNKLLKQRNYNWLPKIEALFGNQQKELVLVGAGHLVGEYNLLTLLNEQGYSVTQISQQDEVL
ncbi:TraB/GumN family protein [Pseudoalteromonas shioyasakiensis]|uniref:TraB/GumN family protein n=1 Tax=Pseudoalteromonas shioyasakiensis TaxID=1190813 RepID=UPI00211862D9|nr:TraB/GumN family protein [Pseudoalteromonas shioyasakiensis]MCQ8879287.1 TraB/GumN family protein [Pseudoalteromonas shioyasakiensis]